MLPEEKPYTWSDLEEIEDGKQYELLDGQLYLLASPSPFHGEISSNLERVLQTFFDMHPRMFSCSTGRGI